MSAAIDFEDDFVLVNFDDYSDEDSSTKTTTKEIEGEIISIYNSSTTDESSNPKHVTPSTSPAKPQSRKTKGRPRSSSTSSEEESLQATQELERQRVRKIMEKKMNGKKKKNNSATIDYALSCAQAELKVKGGKKGKNDITWGR